VKAPLQNMSAGTRTNGHLQHYADFEIPLVG
jgi:hypothetical protein